MSLNVPTEIGQYIPVFLQEKYKRYVINNANTAEAYNVAFNALCAVREFLHKKIDYKEIDEFINKKQTEMWKIGMRNKVPFTYTEIKKNKRKVRA